MKSVLFIITVWFYPIFDLNAQYPPQGKSTSSQTQGTFENYAFVVNEKVIQQHALVDYPGATLDRIFNAVVKNIYL
ncbi:hypothetical protein [Parapedobacter sp. DT-150]|uniref:hypothetical protein n=1 Tax=Parapedobacter sp. DT-150 TaxID=3396162 RepID=UPI003F1D388F